MSPTRAAGRQPPPVSALHKVTNGCWFRATGLTLIGPGVVQVVENRNQHIQHVAALQDEEEEFLLRGGEKLMKHTLLTTHLPLEEPLSKPC